MTSDGQNATTVSLSPENFLTMISSSISNPKCLSPGSFLPAARLNISYQQRSFGGKNIAKRRSFHSFWRLKQGALIFRSDPKFLPKQKI